MAIELDVTKYSEAELLELNRRIAARISAMRQAETYHALASFDLGDRVCFHDRGRHIEGVVIRVNKKTVSIHTDDHSHWNVSPNMLKKIGKQDTVKKADNVIELLKKH